MLPFIVKHAGYERCIRRVSPTLLGFVRCAALCSICAAASVRQHLRSTSPLRGNRRKLKRLQTADCRQLFATREPASTCWLFVLIIALQTLAKQPLNISAQRCCAPVQVPDAAAACPDVPGAHQPLTTRARGTHHRRHRRLIHAQHVCAQNRQWDGHQGRTVTVQWHASLGGGGAVQPAPQIRRPGRHHVADGPANTGAPAWLCHGRLRLKLKGLGTERSSSMRSAVVMSAVHGALTVCPWAGVCSRQMLPQFTARAVPRR